MHFNLMVPSHMRPLTLARICFAWARPSWQALLLMPALILTSILRPPALLMLAEMVSTKLMMPAFLDLRPDILVGCFVSYSPAALIKGERGRYACRTLPFSEPALPSDLIYF